MRSLRHLERELALRRRVDELQHATGDHSDGWGFYAHRRNVLEMQRAQQEISQGAGDFEWAFDGKGVYDGAIALSRFNQLAPLVARSLRGIARDLLFLEGPNQPRGTDLQALTEPVLAAAFDGSFGIRLERAPVSEQIGLFDGGSTLFERTALRAMAIFNAGHSADSEDAILEALRGLRKNTLTALHKLTGQLATAGAPTRLRWQGESIVVVRPEEASRLRDTIFSADPREEEIEIYGSLRGADLDSGNFNIVVPGDEDGREVHYRGHAQPEALAQLREITLDSPVVATLLVIVLDSPVLEIPKRSFVLTGIEQTNPSQVVNSA